MPIMAHPNSAAKSTTACKPCRGLVNLEVRGIHIFFGNSGMNADETSRIIAKCNSWRNSETFAWLVMRIPMMGDSGSNHRSSVPNAFLDVVARHADDPAIEKLSQHFNASLSPSVS
jgi:hypothetical protein